MLHFAFFKKRFTNSDDSKRNRNLLNIRSKNRRQSLNWWLHGSGRCKEREDFEIQTPYI